MTTFALQDRRSHLLSTLLESERLWRWAIPLTIFLLAFLLRALDPISRPLVWGDRAWHFGNAILAHDWATTYQRYHPGVTVMWLSGIGLHLFSYARGGLTADQLLGVAPTQPGTLTASVSAAVIPLALVISLCIALTYLLLRRLVGTRIALVATLLIALDPFHITYSKVVHPDALLASFMYVSALFLLLYFKERRRRQLIFSGIFAGLSFLTKSPSLFLIPYAGLVTAVASFWPLLVPEGRGGERLLEWRLLVSRAGSALAIVGTWLLVACVIFVILWPAMWVKPDDVLLRMADRIFFHTTTAHPNPVYFNGTASEQDPGGGFYLATIAWKTTLVTLPALLVGILLLFRRWRTESGRIMLALAVYAFFFFVQMTLGHFKQIPYILPLAPALSTLAGFGLVAFAARVGRFRWWRDRAGVEVALLGMAIAIQAVVVAANHPRMGNHYNLLLGGGRVAQDVLPLQDNGEGLRLAARFLNELPHGQDETAIIPPRNAIVFQREFIGRTSTEVIPWATYRVYSVNEVMRGMLKEEWLEQWEADRKEEPLFTVSFHGTPYVWVYGERPIDPAAGGARLAVNSRLGEDIALKSVRVSEGQRVVAGESFTVVLYWQADDQPAEDYVVFTHLLSAEGELVAQHDSVPLLGVRPTSTWRAGELLEDAHTLSLPADLEPGTYYLSTGMYQPETLQRLPAYDADGQPLANGRVELLPLQVVAPERQDS